jgi:MFS family permease
MKDRMNIDEVFSHIGELGKQQLRYSLLLSILGMYGAQIMLQYTFVGHDMSFICKLENGSKLVDECPNGETSKCAEIIFDTSDTSSINSEWNLVCDRTWLSPLTMSLFMSGVMIGSLILGAVADAVGRKKTLSMAFLML